MPAGRRGGGPPPQAGMFPFFYANIQDGGAIAVPDKARYTRFLRLLPDGSLPSDMHVLAWASTWPQHDPLMSHPGSCFSYLPKEGPPNALLLQLGHKRGAVHIYFKQNGKVMISANAEQCERILGKILKWTAPFNKGVPPALPGPDPLPPAHLLASNFPARK